MSNLEKAPNLTPHQKATFDGVIKLIDEKLKFKRPLRTTYKTTTS